MAKAIDSTLDPQDEVRIVNKIKRINERYAEFKRKFKKYPHIIEDYRNAIELAIPSRALTPQGTISRGKNTLKIIDEEMLDELLRKQTAGETNKTVKKQEKIEKASGLNVMAQDILDAMERVYKVMQEDPDEFYEAVKEYWHVMGIGSPKPSYMTIDTIIQANRAAGKGRTVAQRSKAEEAAQNEKDKLFKRLKADAEPLNRYFN